VKLAVFDHDKLGVVVADRVVDVTAALDGRVQRGPDRMIGVIEQFAALRPVLESAAAAGPSVPLDAVKLGPPLRRPANIVAMAVNYLEGRTEAAAANAFQKSPSSIIGHGDTMVLPDAPATIFEGEAELAVVIGKRATRVAATDALSYVFGYMNLIDGSARGLGPPGTFFQVKARDTFCPIGPFIVTADEVRDPQRLQVRLWVNGELRQNFNTSDMARTVATCIAWASSVHTLEPGDILSTGTDHRGLSAFQDGDRVELEIDGLGRLGVAVRDELRRTWSRDTRAEHEAKGHKGQTPQLTGKYAPAATS
jgi:2-keto-4-pentenoate hydratase/2-oxohepta-3-ene-1,7-dioic acid hydratase in catechol pathway